MNILLTGANGFIGSQLMETLESKSGFELKAAVRQHVDFSAANTVRVPGMGPKTNWVTALSNQQVVIHAAGRAHVMKRQQGDWLAEYRRINVHGTLNLAQQAVNAGVQRFIFISSIKVNGEKTRPGQRFTADDKPAPEDAYGISKHDAEKDLMQLAKNTGLELVIIRPPLVYGPAAKGNFAKMLSLLKMGVPLPLGAIHNQRSFVALDNLVDLIITCIDHPAAVNQVFLAGDGQDLSTTELLCRVSRLMGKPALLIPIPECMLMFGLTVVGKKASAHRLLNSLQVDVSKAKNLLGWKPPISVDEGLSRCFISKGD